MLRICSFSYLCFGFKMPQTEFERSLAQRSPNLIVWLKRRVSQYFWMGEGGCKSPASSPLPPLERRRTRRPWAGFASIEWRMTPATFDIAFSAERDRGHQLNITPPPPTPAHRPPLSFFSKRTDIAPSFADPPAAAFTSAIKTFCTHACSWHLKGGRDENESQLEDDDDDDETSLHSRVNSYIVCDGGKIDLRRQSDLLASRLEMWTHECCGLKGGALKLQCKCKSQPCPKCVHF